MWCWCCWSSIYTLETTNEYLFESAPFLTFLLSGRKESNSIHNATVCWTKTCGSRFLCILYMIACFNDSHKNVTPLCDEMDQYKQLLVIFLKELQIFLLSYVISMASWLYAFSHWIGEFLNFVYTYFILQTTDYLRWTRKSKHSKYRKMVQNRKFIKCWKIEIMKHGGKKER